MVRLLFGLRLCCLILAFVCIPGTANSSENSLQLELPDGQEFEVTRFPGAWRFLAALVAIGTRPQACAQNACRGAG